MDRLDLWDTARSGGAGVARGAVIAKPKSQSSIPLSSIEFPGEVVLLETKKVLAQFQLWETVCESRWFMVFLVLWFDISYLLARTHIRMLH